MSLVQVLVVCSPPGDGSSLQDWLIDEREALRKVDPLTVRPYIAGLKAGEAGIEDTVKLVN